MANGYGHHAKVGSTVGVDVGADPERDMVVATKVLPPEVIHRRPRLILGQAIVALYAGRLNDVEPLFTPAERTFDPTGDEPYEASIGRRASILANVPAAIAVGRADLACLRGDSERGCEFGRAALRYLTDDGELLGEIARYHLAVANWLAGRLEQAERALAAGGRRASYRWAPHGAALWFRPRRHPAGSGAAQRSGAHFPAGA